MKVTVFLSKIQEGYDATGQLCIFALEKGIRDYVFKAGSNLLCIFLSSIGELSPDCPECGKRMRRSDTRSKSIVSLMGDGEIKRGYYECDYCGTHHIPRDAELDIVGTAFTPGVRRSVSKLASSDSFEWSSNTLSELTGVYVSSKECQRIAEETGEGIEEIFELKK